MRNSRERILRGEYKTTFTVEKEIEGVKYPIKIITRATSITPLLYFRDAIVNRGPDRDEPMEFEPDYDSSEYYIEQDSTDFDVSSIKFEDSQAEEDFTLSLFDEYYNEILDKVTNDTPTYEYIDYE